MGNANNLSMNTNFETQVCSRCNGSGSYSYCQDYGSKCFKCAGSGKTLTKRGAAARAYLDTLCTKPATEIRVNDRVLAHGVTNGGKAFSYIGTVTNVQTRVLQRTVVRTLRQGTDVIGISGTMTFNGEFVSSWGSSTCLKTGELANEGTVTEDFTEVTVTVSSKYGETRICGATEFRTYPADNEAKIKLSLEYQNTLTKQGTVRKTAKSA